MFMSKLSLKTIQAKNPEYDIEDLSKAIRFAQTHPFEFNGYIPVTVALWIEQLHYFIDYQDKVSYDYTCQNISNKGFDFLIPIMETAYAKPLFD